MTDATPWPTPDPILAAKRADLPAFLATYDPATTPRLTSPSTGQTVLFGALANQDPAARVGIAERLLDDGADASIVTTPARTTVLHVLLSRLRFDPVGDARVLRRLVAGGADVNLPDARRGAPLAMLASSTRISDADAEPMYRALLEHPAIDLAARASPTHTVRELVLNVAPDRRPILTALVRELLDARGQPS